MNEIIIKISIPESEYKGYNYYDPNNLTELKSDLKESIKFGVKQSGIDKFEIEVI